MNLYFLMSALFILLAIVGAVDAALTSYDLIPYFTGIRWLRVHLITLGAMTEAIFGILPLIVAERYGTSRPRFRWGIWLLLNAGILILLVGMPIVNQALIFTGGTLIFVATTLKMWQLGQVRAGGLSAKMSHADSRRFYIVGLSYLLLGIFIGTGLWLGWMPALKMQVPLEVHIHANNWGFLSLLFAGIFIDSYPTWAGKPLAPPRTINAIFWLMSIGALGLVLGPWFQSLFFTVPGLIMHIGATVWLLVSAVKALQGNKTIWRNPGIWHLLTAYIWILLPVLVAPLVLLGVSGFPGAGIEQNAPQALIYGWVLQFGFAIIPYFFRRVFHSAQANELGGSWVSLILIHLGGISLWASIFITDFQSFLHGSAYTLWALAIVPIALDVWRIVQSGWMVEDRVVG